MDLIQINSGQDFWLVMRDNARAKVLCFTYAEDAPQWDVRAVISRALEWAGVPCQSWTLDWTDFFKRCQVAEGKWELCPLGTGKTESFDCEGDLLLFLLANAPSYLDKPARAGASKRA